MSIYTEANSLFSEADDLLGESVTFGAVTVKAIKNELPIDVIMEASGYTQKVEIEFAVRKALLVTKPAHKSSVVYNGVTYKVHDVSEDEVFYNVQVYKP